MATGGTRRTKGGGASAPTSTSTPTSTSCEPPSVDSKRHWEKPNNVREFAAQVNQVATLVLNGQIDLDQARTFSALARVVTQAMSLQITKSRFLKVEPDLEL